MRMGVPNVPLGQLIRPALGRITNTSSLPISLPLNDWQIENGRVTGPMKADAYVLAVPFEECAAIAPELELDICRLSRTRRLPASTLVRRKITDLPHATLLDRTIQWMYNKKDGKHLQLVVSASRSLTEMPRADVIALALKELAEFFPNVAQRKLVKAHVVKEVPRLFGRAWTRRATAIAEDESDLFLAGDWTRTGSPATMEGAVRSGYLAAEAVSSQKLLLPDR